MGNRYVILTRGVSSILDTSRDFLMRGHGMNVNAVKHQAKLQEWKGRVADCRSSGMSVKHWCEENDCSPQDVLSVGAGDLGKSKANYKGRVSALPSQECSKRRNPFVPVLVIRFGQVELELSNAVSSELLSQVKELMHLVE